MKEGRRSFASLVPGSDSRLAEQDVVPLFVATLIDLELIDLFDPRECGSLLALHVCIRHRGLRFGLHNIDVECGSNQKIGRVLGWHPIGFQIWTSHEVVLVLVKLDECLSPGAGPQ